jgi:hypothetical protein
MAFLAATKRKKSWCMNSLPTVVSGSSKPIVPKDIQRDPGRWEMVDGRVEMTERRDHEIQD